MIPLFVVGLKLAVTGWDLLSYKQNRKNTQ